MKKYKVLESFIYYNRKDNSKRIIQKDSIVFILKKEKGGWIGHIFYDSIIELYDSRCIFIGYDITTYFNLNILSKLKFIDYNNAYLFWKRDKLTDKIGS